MTSSYTSRFETLRPKLIAFSLLQVQDREHAEDLVQDALIAALENIDKYEGSAQFDTWVYGILRHKLIDYIRRTKRERERFVSDDHEIDIDSLFDNREHWDADSKPEQWKSPEDLHLRSDFWEVFDLCMLHLPSNTARVFALRELMDLETEEICECLDISEQNCWTILHRARLKLRGCIEKGWFLKGSPV
ncbi:sigma-70 family RNA polymerase sigma factor [Neptunomonas concharum]|uniref:Sigma-70 family RNA polymerase sigma factor n=1 Tax=Neptunomonas concharum TaxID=1031538 RepID=A0A5P1RE36_9GAMM|nr:sigma-70 family RNA polymerase sigma factor [Neptunomonas concharum]QEQ97873.1 sigma-70 family RNA polymerase sigma factor [Neptunomonas concharum]